jgi:hypothetical protein
MENFEKGAVITPETQEQPKTKTEQSEFVPVEEIKPEILADIKREDAGGMEKAREEIAGFDKGVEDAKKAKAEKKAEYISLMTAKLQEMEEAINEKENSRLFKFLHGKEDFAKARLAVGNYRKMLESGKLPDMTSVKESPSLKAFVEKVDVSELPENPDKKYSGPASAGSKMMSNF